MGTREEEEAGPRAAAELASGGKEGARPGGERARGGPRGTYRGPYRGISPGEVHRETLPEDVGGGARPYRGIWPGGNDLTGGCTRGGTTLPGEVAGRGGGPVAAAVPRGQGGALPGRFKAPPPRTEAPEGPTEPSGRAGRGGAGPPRALHALHAPRADPGRGTRCRAAAPGGGGGRERGREDEEDGDYDARRTSRRTTGAGAPLRPPRSPRGGPPRRAGRSARARRGDVPDPPRAPGASPPGAPPRATSPGEVPRGVRPYRRKYPGGYDLTGGSDRGG